MGQRNYNQDLELIFHDGAAAVTADGAGQVGGQPSVRDVGLNSRFEAVMVFDVSAIDVSSADERYIICVQGSNTADFSGAKENLAVLELGATAVRAGGALTSTIGRYEVGWANEQDNALYRYIRVYVDVAGTTPSLTFKAWSSTKF